MLSMIPRRRPKRDNLIRLKIDLEPARLTRTLKSVAHLALALLCLMGMWLYVDRVMVGHQVTEAAHLSIPRGNLSDLYPVWVGSRELFLRHRNPYGLDVRREIQAGYYGRPLDPGRAHDPTNEQAFAYPPYVGLLLAPTVKLPFGTVRVIFFWLLAILTALSVPFWLSFLRWKLESNSIVVAVLLTLGCFAAVQGLKLQQLSLLVAFFIAASLVLLSREKLISAGLVMSLATIKPQLTVVLVLWLMAWAVFRWRARWKFAISFLAGFAALSTSAEILLPGWLWKFAGAVSAYERYAASGPLLTQMLPFPMAVLVMAGVSIALAAVCFRARHVESSDSRFIVLTAASLAITLLLIPMYPPHYQLLLLPGIFLLVRNWRELWARGIAGKALLASVAVPLGWSWASAIALAAASFFTPGAQNFWQLPLWTSVVLPIPVVACLGLLTWKAAFLKTES